ncbi:MAG: M6 family metalloprotease domain-containing protein [Candidatus Helarchaeota archaeon]
MTLSIFIGTARIDIDTRETNDYVSEQIDRIHDQPLDLIAEYTPPSEPVIGDKKTVVIRIDFSDQIGLVSKNYHEQMLFGGHDGAMNDYYREISYNKLNVTGEIVGNGWYRSAHTKVYYGADDVTGHDNLNGPIYELAREAAILADDAVDFSQYDIDHDGIVDHLIIIYAGDSQSTSGQPNDIWAHRWNIYGTPLYLDGVRLYGYTAQAENSKMGTFAHEFGHDIGLPDLYDINYASEFVRKWGLMASGGHNDAGYHPAHMTSWSKMQLGWIDSSKIATVMDGEIKTFLLEPLELASSQIQVIKIPLTSTTYFLVENRQKLGYDLYLPDDAVIISYVDESLSTGQGIVKVQDANPGSNPYPTDLEDAPFSSETGEVVIYRNSTYDVVITVCRRVGYNYEVCVDRYFPPKSYTSSDFNSGFEYWFSWDNVVAGQIIMWDWTVTNPSYNWLDFWIKKSDSSTLYEETYNTISDGGSFRVPEDGKWELHFRNDGASQVTINKYFVLLSSPNIVVLNFYETPTTIYESQYFDLVLDVRNFGGSFVEDAIATISLPAGLSTNNTWMEIGNLNYMEQKTVTWRIQGITAGTHQVQVQINCTWGGTLSDTEWITVSTDSVDPTISITSPTNGFKTANRDLVVEWSGSDGQTGIDYYRLILDSGAPIILDATSYVLSNLAEGTHTITVEAFDESGRSSSDSISVTIDSSDPSNAQIISLSNGEEVEGNVNIIVSAQDLHTSIDRVEFWDGLPGIGTLLWVDVDDSDGWSFSWNTNLAGNGWHQIYIRVFDELGNSLNSTGVSINVNNVPAVDPLPTFDLENLLSIVFLLLSISMAIVAGVFSILWIKGRSSKNNRTTSRKKAKKAEFRKYFDLEELDIPEKPTSPAIVSINEDESFEESSTTKKIPAPNIVSRISDVLISDLIILIHSFRDDMIEKFGNTDENIAMLDEWDKKLTRYPISKLVPSDSEELALAIEKWEKLLSHSY